MFSLYSRNPDTNGKTSHGEMKIPWREAKSRGYWQELCSNPSSLIEHLLRSSRYLTAAQTEHVRKCKSQLHNGEWSQKLCLEPIGTYGRRRRRAARQLKPSKCMCLRRSSLGFAWIKTARINRDSRKRPSNREVLYPTQRRRQAGPLVTNRAMVCRLLVSLSRDPWAREVWNK